MSDIVNEAVGSIYDKGDPEMAELGRRLQKVAITVKDEDRANMIAITGAEMISSDGNENKLKDKLMVNYGISPKQYDIWKEKAKTLPPFSGDDVPDTGSSDDTSSSDDAPPRDDDDARKADKFAKLKTKG